MTTPARRQYLNMKHQHQEEILLFRMGDFYETFDEDARIVSKDLEIALTSREMGRGQRVPLAGIPYHALDSYLAKLIKKGHRVAICEQTSDPATSKGLVDREVVRVVTPGTVVEDSVLDEKTNNYLASVVLKDGEAGLSYVDITTSEFATSQFHESLIPVELARLTPSEILVPSESDDILPDLDHVVTPIGSEHIDFGWARTNLLKHFKVSSLEAFGCEDLPLAVLSANIIIEYLSSKQKSVLGQLTSMYTYSTASYMVLDPQTRRNLELFRGGRWGDSTTSLITTLDRTHTPMGARMLRRWVGQPLLQTKGISQRQQAVTWFHHSSLRRGKVVDKLKLVSDIERLMNRTSRQTASPRDLVGLRKSLEVVPDLRTIMQEDDGNSEISWITEQIIDNSETVELISNSITDEPSGEVGDGRVIRKGFSQKLDTLRSSSQDAQQYIAKLERTERDRTGIKSLKVGYNKVFGYYIEISNPNLSSVPDNYVRRQTLVGGERFITPEMKEYESIILNAQDRVRELEISLFRQVCHQASQSASSIMSTANTIAQIDAFCSLGWVAAENKYVLPVIDESENVRIKDGRHPVVETMLPLGEFVPNDTFMSNSEEQLLLLTGPNMAGKSTYIRQVALIVLMTQIGSFVPAEYASIGIVDRIFTRVGLQDDVSVGHSTFMVEMVETASIINHATSRSLVILDEIGRGTSTYDGLAIAQSVAEYVHNHPQLGCKTLFATHYHELTELSDYLPRVRNYNVSVIEKEGAVVFLRKIVAGGADRSYGIHVARLAGLPNAVISRAREILAELEDNYNDTHSKNHNLDTKIPEPQQLSLLSKPLPFLEELLSLDISSITPIEAITKLYELQEQVKKIDGTDPIR